MLPFKAYVDLSPSLNPFLNCVKLWSSEMEPVETQSAIRQLRADSCTTMGWDLLTIQMGPLPGPSRPTLAVGFLLAPD